MERSPDFVAYEVERGVYVACLGHERAHAGLAHFGRYVEVYHVVFAVEADFDDAPRAAVYNRPAAYELRVVAARAEYDFGPVAGQVGYIVPVQAYVVAVERRKQLIVDDCHAVNVGQQVFVQRCHYVLVAWHGASIQLPYGVNRAVAFYVDRAV